MNGQFGDALVAAREAIRFSLDFFANLAKVDKCLFGQMQKLRVFSRFRIKRRRVVVNELQNQRAPRHNVLSARQKVSLYDIFQHGRFAYVPSVATKMRDDTDRSTVTQPRQFAADPEPPTGAQSIRKRRAGG
jgi:hypothetical protein